MKIDLRNIQAISATYRVSTRCPHCGHNGTFENVLPNDAQEQMQKRIVGIRRCPNQDCYGHLFFVMSDSRKIILTYPSDAIPFERKSIPDKVINSFEEAIKCHSTNCFIASAIMLRKTLEEICNDRGATGK